MQLLSVKLTAKAPENQWLEDEFPFGMTSFRRQTVSFSECSPNWSKYIQVLKLSECLFPFEMSLSFLGGRV